MRTFIAIDLDRPIKDRVIQLLTCLDCEAKNIRWVKPQGMHVTLKFLGDVSAEQAAEVETVLEKIIREHRAFPIKVRGTGRFPPGQRTPRVFWVGIEGGEVLLALQADLEDGLAGIHFPKENRAFHPHLTLGRVKSVHNLSPVLSELERHQDADFGEMTVRRITFFQSTLKPSGAEYTVISEFNLR